MHTAIALSLDENQRQEQLLKNQSIVTAEQLAVTNSTSNWKKLKEKAQKRISDLGVVIDVGNLGYNAYLKVNSISRLQANIFSEIQQTPELLLSVYKDEIKFIQEADLLIRYLTGIALQVVDILGMDNGDRQIIINFIMNEFDRLEGTCRNTLTTISYAKIAIALREQRTMRFLTEDVDLIKQIINNAKSLYS